MFHNYKPWCKNVLKIFLKRFYSWSSSSNISRWFWPNMLQKTYFLLKINMGEKTPAQTRRFSSEHRWNAGHEKCAPTLGFSHSGARPFELDFKFCFRSTTSWLAYFHRAAEGKRSTTKWKRLKVHKEEKRPCILAHTATVVMTGPDYDLYFWATDNNI